MTPEQIRAWRELCNAKKLRTPRMIELAKLDALLEIALQLAELNAREDAKAHVYNIPGVDGVPPARRKDDNPAVPFKPLESLETRPSE